MSAHRTLVSGVCRILIVDDNPAIHEDFRKILEVSGKSDPLDDLSAELFGTPAPVTPLGRRFEIESAYQGQEGLEVLQEALEHGCPFSLAFVDMRMPPGWDGLETIEHFWQADPDLLVVVCTAFADHSWLEVAERLGNNDRWLVLKKPFDNAEVYQMATVYAEKRRLLDLARSHASCSWAQVPECAAVGVTSDVHESIPQA